MDQKTIQAIEAILRRGNDAKVRRKGGGYVVVEIKETIKLSPPAIVAGEGQSITNTVNIKPSRQSQCCPQ